MFPGVCWGPKDKRRAVVFVRMGWGGEGSRRGHQLCKTARPKRKARPRYSLCPSQQGNCLSLQEGVPVGKLRLKSCFLPLSGGLTIPPPAQGGGCQRGEAPPPRRVSTQKPWQNAPEAGAQHTSASAGGRSGLFSEAGTNRNEFPDCSILLPGP